METTLQRFIQKLELNENAVSTILGAVVLVIVGFLFLSYFRDSQLETQTIVEEQQTQESGSIGQTSSAATTRYTVTEADSLWSIAQDNYGDGYKWVEIAIYNGMTDPDEIAAGMLLDLPRIEDITTAPIENVAGAIDEQPTEENSSEYIVQPGDFMFLVAQKVYGDGDAWNRIWQANKDKVPNPEILEKGTVLTIP